MVDLIAKVFSDWEHGPLKSYRFAQSSEYAGIDRGALWHASLNAFIKTENDVQMKFGGFLENALLEEQPTLTVHAELNPYDGEPRWLADLSVHDVSDSFLWTTREPNAIVETVRAVVEIKFANFRDPDWLFQKGYIRSDLEKLSRLQEGVTRIMLILDESGSVSPQYVAETKAQAQQNHVTILSNNQNLKYVAA